MIMKHIHFMLQDIMDRNAFHCLVGYASAAF